MHEESNAHFCRIVGFCFNTPEISFPFKLSVSTNKSPTNTPFIFDKIDILFRHFILYRKVIEKIVPPITLFQK